MQLAAEIQQVLSAERFGTYLTVCGNNVGKACELYIWNMQVSSAFFPWLSMAEVVLRNQIHLVLSQIHGANWPWENGFERTLPQPKRGFKPLEELQKTRQKYATGFQTGKVIADLKFAFWQQMLKKNQEAPLWNKYLYTAFPYLNQTLSIAVNREEVYQHIEQIRELRNRIAHHEPIFQRNLNDDYQNIVALITTCCSPDLINWLKFSAYPPGSSLSYLEFLLQHQP